MTKQAHKNLAMVVLVTCISFIGMALPYPMLAPLYRTIFFKDNLIFSKEVMYGITLQHILGTVFGSIYLGKISDQQGRKVLQISILELFGFLSAITLYSRNLLS